jgi:hypothetical protein
MSRMGADGYSSAGQTRLSAKVAEPLKQDFKAACEARSETMTDVIEAKMREVVDEHGGDPVDDGEGYYPSDSKLRELYETCLKFSDADHGLKIYQRRHASSIAQETQTSKSDLADALIPLRQRGYVALGPMPVDLTGRAAERWRHWYVKPPCADPTQWKHRETRGER